MTQKQGRKIRVTQTRGTAGRPALTKRTLAALGLGRVGKSKEFTVNAAVKGMIESVSHLVDIEVAD
ncbi:MAG: 50S ribosomal protein L30 [Bdellovibrionales bacterium]|nr:50S ribosomal protein L30 [Bdellovibrionales bacterium]